MINCTYGGLRVSQQIKKCSMHFTSLNVFRRKELVFPKVTGLELGHREAR
jgi:hypothetical protein